MATSKPSSSDDLREQLRAKLLATRDGWQHRLDAIQKDRRRQATPLEPDFAEQATQRENDDALDALDARGRGELAAIESALKRLDSDRFGLCAGCGEPIAAARLQAQPTAATCISCTKEAGPR